MKGSSFAETVAAILAVIGIFVVFGMILRACDGSSHKTYSYKTSAYKTTYSPTRVLTKAPTKTPTKAPTKTVTAAPQKTTTKKTTEMPDCDDYDSYEDFMDDWDGNMPDGSDAEDYWENW